MADLFFPQLASGALAQYPIRKTKTLRTVKNILADGSMLVAEDPGAGQLVWNLSYVDLSTVDMNALQAHFEACAGPLRAFTFLDPTDNLLANSSDFTASAWTVPAGVTIQSGLADPLGGAAAFTIVNGASATQEITQAVPVPVGFQYCFSLYASAANASTCALICQSTNAQQTQTFSISPGWQRLSLSAQLNDAGIGLSLGISLAAGQSISLFGPQLEPQFAPSRFRPTYSTSGVYPNAHWAVQELVITPDAPNLFSTSFVIESSVGT
jgi:hypothetical protein